MLSSFVGWIMFSSSSSSSSSSQYEAEEDDDDDSRNDCVSTEPRDHIDINITNDEEKNDVVSADDDRDIPVGIAVPTDAFASVTVALPATVAPIGDRDRPSIATTTTVIGNRKRRRNDDVDVDDDEDGRRLFHRLWTKEDEMELLRGFLDYTTRRGSTQCKDTALFYDQIRSKLHVAFNKNQLLEKLRRLKKKYRNFLHKIGSNKEFSFRNAHDQATFEISRKIWGVDHDQPISHHNLDSLNLVNVKVESDEVVGDWRPPKPTKSPLGLRSNEKHVSNNGSTSNQKNDSVSDSMEETVRSCLSPLFKKLLSNALSPMPATLNLVGGEAADEKWREQRILELEVYSKRLELIQDQIKGALEELRSMGG
ncbi:probable transcription factor At3g04930 [Corylus avellana]|uniref:probable transcription factor At3g04930 n=1 Tax=Corylus avellana TaxID=13451 RepID=UPI00286A7DE3|nr:probable transcription factor At3g04930 [Corylus avellana]